VPAAGRLKYLFLAFLSKPTHERRLYRLIRRRRPTRIVELGLGNGRRAVRMIGVAQGSLAAGRSTPGQISYAAIDLFEARPADQPASLPLKEAYRLLKPTGARVRLTPGDPLSALSRTANELTGTDLLLIASDVDAASLAKAWFYVPRMLHAGSLVLIEDRDATTGALSLRQLTIAEIDTLAAVRERRRAA
jgi:hypothetical protein